MISVISFVHVAITKFKERRNTPVIQINIIQNLDVESPPQIIINNQAYNKDLVTIRGCFIIITISGTYLFLILFAMQSDISQLVATYFDVEIDLYFNILLHIRDFMYAVLLSFVIPLIVILSSSELRPFLYKIVSKVQF